MQHIRITLVVIVVLIYVLLREFSSLFSYNDAADVNNGNTVFPALVLIVQSDICNRKSIHGLRTSRLSALQGNLVAGILLSIK